MREPGPAAIYEQARRLRARYRDQVAFGSEIGTGCSELIDPAEERARLTAQSLPAAGGDIDEDFAAPEHGRPPERGMGMDFERLLILPAGASFREPPVFSLIGRSQADHATIRTAPT